MNRTTTLIVLSILGLLIAMVFCCGLGCKSVPPDLLAQLQARAKAEIQKVLAQPDVVLAPEEKPIETSDPVVGPDGAAGIFASSTFHSTKPEVANWPIQSTLTVTRYGANRFRMDVDDSTMAKWPRDASINILCTLQADDGTWHTAPCDWVKPLPNVKKLECMCVCNGDDRIMEARNGRWVGFTLAPHCRHTLGDLRFRSTTVWMLCDWEAGK